MLGSQTKTSGYRLMAKHLAARYLYRLTVLGPSIAGKTMLITINAFSPRGRILPRAVKYNDWLIDEFHQC